MSIVFGGDKILASLHGEARHKVDKVFSDLIPKTGPSVDQHVRHLLKFGWGGHEAEQKVTGQLITARSFNELIDRLNIGIENTGINNVELDRQLPQDQIILAAYYNAITAYAEDLLMSPNELNPARARIAQIGNAARTTSWQKIITLVYDTVFPNFDHIRYFFNSGSTIRMDFSQTGNRPGNGYRDWEYMFLRTGIISYGINGLSISGNANFTDGHIPYVKLNSAEYQLLGTIHVGGQGDGYGGYGGYGAYGNPMYIRVYGKLVGNNDHAVRFKAELDNINATGLHTVYGNTNCQISYRKPINNSRPTTRLHIAPPEFTMITELRGS